LPQPSGSKKRPRDWNNDDVAAVVNDKLRRGVKGKSLEGESLQVARPLLIDNTRQYNLMRRVGSSKSIRQQMSETITIPDELPQLPERMREFAFRYATEFRRTADWAQIFHVSPFTVRNWLLKPKVMQYILKLKQERQSLMIERVTDLEATAYRKLREILDIPFVSVEAAELVRQTASDVLQHLSKLRDKGGAPAVPSTVVNVNQQTAVTASTTSDVEVQQLENRIAELNAIDEMLGKEGHGGEQE
jgi:hypothetical protein